MPVPNSHPSNHRFGKAALLAGALIAALFVALSWSRLYLTGRSPGGVDEIALGVLVDLLLAIVAFVPFLLAVLFVVADPSRRAVARGTALIYMVDLCWLSVRHFWASSPSRCTPSFSPYHSPGS